MARASRPSMRWAPARPRAGPAEPLFEELGYTDKAESACLVLEVDKRPPAALIEKAAAACGVAPERLTLILTPTRSLAGTVQIAAPGPGGGAAQDASPAFPAGSRDRRAGRRPAAAAGPFLHGRHGPHQRRHHLWRGGAALRPGRREGGKLAEALPSRSRDYGRPFAEIFKAYKGNFYDIDRCCSARPW